jgi:hypothetical protein
MQESVEFQAADVDGIPMRFVLEGPPDRIADAIRDVVQRVR